MAVFQPATSPPLGAETNLLVVAATRGNQLTAPAAEVDGALEGALVEHLNRTRSLGGSGLSPFDGKLGQATIFPSMGKLPASAVMVVGLGDAEKVTHKQVRRAAGVAARGAGGYSRVTLGISDGVAGGAQAAAEGFELGGYCFAKYLTDKPNAAEYLEVGGATEAELTKARVTADAVVWARDVVNEPPSNRGPEVFAQLAKERAAAAGLRVEIFNESVLELEGMNGILTVGKGSASPPRFVVLTYEPEGARGLLGLVGKGITFDSGGLSIKTGEGMETMKMDCAGAAAVVAAICALPALGPKIKVIAAVALAENMPGGRAVKPGDVIRHYGGRTSEVLNTDAEGRLVLADALAWMAERKPDAMVNLATLTGGMVVALGTRVAGVMSTMPELAQELLASARRTDEPLWEMPFIDEYRGMLDSPVADLKNISGSRHASPIIAGLFLKDFVGQTPWAHLDIAGPAYSAKGEHYLPAGATGYGTRLLIDWIENRSHTDGD